MRSLPVTNPPRGPTGLGLGLVMMMMKMLMMMAGDRDCIREAHCLLIHEIDFPISCTAMSSRYHDDEEEDDYDEEEDDNDNNKSEYGHLDQQ